MIGFGTFSNSLGTSVYITRKMFKNLRLHDRKMTFKSKTPQFFIASNSFNIKNTFWMWTEQNTALLNVLKSTVFAHFVVFFSFLEMDCVIYSSKIDKTQPTTTTSPYHDKLESIVCFLFFPGSLPEAELIAPDAPCNWILMRDQQKIF